MYAKDDNPIRFFEGWAVMIALGVVGVGMLLIGLALFLAWTAFGG